MYTVYSILTKVHVKVLFIFSNKTRVKFIHIFSIYLYLLLRFGIKVYVICNLPRYANIYDKGVQIYHNKWKLEDFFF